MKKKKLLLILTCLALLSGCTKTLKDKDNKAIRNEKTGQSITENILCRPTDEYSIKIYEENDIDIEKLPVCTNMKINEGTNEGLWTSIFVKPLAWLIIKIGMILKNYGLAIIISTLLIRIAVFPITKKTAMQSENMKLAQPELEALERRYADKTSQEDQMRKSQEMLMVYQKYKINPISGCLLAFIQLPLFFAYLEAINRVPAIFESEILKFNKYFTLNMGMTPIMGVSSGHYIYILLVVLIIATTYFSFKKTLADQSGPQAKQMKYTIYIMLIFISFSALYLPTALGLYWITSSLCTILQNKLVEKRKKAVK